jgi:hypothetical protein
MGDNLRVPQKTSKSSVKGARKKAANMAKAKAVGDAKDRKNATGRVNAPNHDNPLSGKKPNDRHQHGLEVVAKQKKRQNKK